jgi:hypothetical protein
MYISVGKVLTPPNILQTPCTLHYTLLPSHQAFVLTARSDVESRLEKEVAEITKTQQDLTDREEYLTRRMASHQNNLKDLTGQ